MDSGSNTVIVKSELSDILALIELLIISPFELRILISVGKDSLASMGMVCG